MVIQRGDIWWAELPEPTGSEPGYERPVLVVQADAFNNSRIHTVIVVGLTANLNLANAPGNVSLPRQATGLPKPSVANISQLLTIDKSFLSRRVRALRRQEFLQVQSGLKLILGLSAG